MSLLLKNIVLSVSILIVLKIAEYINYHLTGGSWSRVGYKTYSWIYFIYSLYAILFSVAWSFYLIRHLLIIYYS